MAGDGGGGGRRSEDLRVVFLRVGAAVALSVAGLLLSRRRPRQQLRLPPPPPRSGINSRGVLFNVFFFISGRNSRFSDGKQNEISTKNWNMNNILAQFQINLIRFGPEEHSDPPVNLNFWEFRSGIANPLFVADCYS